MNVTLAQLARMTPEQQATRLWGIDETTRLKLMTQAAALLTNISSAKGSDDLKIVV